MLRGFREDDLDEHSAILSDPVVMEHFGGHLFGREESWRRLLGGVGLWQLQGTGLFAAERKSDGKLVGHVGLFDYHRDMAPSIEGVPELGYIFGREVHGRGVAREACDAVLGWADETLEAEEMVAIISIGNEPSMKLARRLGFERQEDAIYRDEPITLWRRRRERGQSPTAAASTSTAA